MKKYLLMLTVLLGSALMMQGFQCASKEISSAKNAMVQLKDNNKAMEYLNAEIAKNPTSGEAHLLQAKIYIERSQYTEASAALVKAEKYIKDPKLIAEKQQTVALFIKDVNTAITGHLNKAEKIKKMAYLLDSALVLTDAVLAVKPYDYSMHGMAAHIYELKEDNDKAIESYQKYIAALEPEMKLAKKYNLTIKMPRTKLVESFGKPTHSIGAPNPTFDTVITDKYIIDGKEAYFLTLKDQGELVVVGWRYDLPANLSENEKMTWRPLSTEAYTGMAAIYYGKNDKAKALECIKGMVELDPTDSDTYAKMIQLYQELNRIDDAKALLNERIAKDPGSKLYLAQFGDLYLAAKEYDKAIEQYNKALKIDPKYDFVLMNIAATYKNKAASIQTAEKDKQSADSKYQIDVTKYMPFVEQSINYFEQAATTERFKNDFSVKTELATLYLIANQKDKLNKLITDLESMESTLENEKKEEYYLKMASIYGAIGNEEKRIEATKKYEDMLK